MLFDIYDDKLVSIVVIIYVESKYTADHLREIIIDEQSAYFESMNIPKGTAKNSALLENIFMMLVCIINKIPLFVVGNPGTKKAQTIANF